MESRVDIHSVYNVLTHENVQTYCKIFFFHSVQKKIAIFFNNEKLTRSTMKGPILTNNEPLPSSCQTHHLPNRFVQRISQVVKPHVSVLAVMGEMPSTHSDSYHKTGHGTSKTQPVLPIVTKSRHQNKHSRMSGTVAVVCGCKLRCGDGGGVGWMCVWGG